MAVEKNLPGFLARVVYKEAGPEVWTATSTLGVPRQGEQGEFCTPDREPERSTHPQHNHINLGSGLSFSFQRKGWGIIKNAV